MAFFEKQSKEIERTGFVTCNGLHGGLRTCNGPWHKEGVRVTGKSVRDHLPDERHHLGSSLLARDLALVLLLRLPFRGPPVFKYLAMQMNYLFCLFIYFPQIDHSFGSSGLLIVGCETL